MWSESLQKNTLEYFNERLMAHSYPKGCYFKSISDIKDKHITVMGLGLNGGGEACVRFFLKHGAFVIATDMKTEEQLRTTVDSLKNDKTLDLSRLTFRLGEHRIEDFENVDCVIKNPGVKYDGNKYLAVAKAIETDLSIFLSFTESPIIAVTGSKGKSSTVSAIHYGLSQAGYKTFLGGNITVSPLTFLDETTSETPVVIEFSSWQLADLRGRKVLKPYISIITKIVPDHQNWYGNMESYVDDKKLIYADQDNGCYSIFDNGKDEIGTEPATSPSWGDEFAKESRATVLRYGILDRNDSADGAITNGKNSADSKDFTSPLGGQFGAWQDKDENGEWCGKVFLPNMEKPEIVLKSLSVPGDHMKTNVLNAALVLYLMNVPAEKIIRILGGWSGIEHRLQFFHEYKPNDSFVYKFYNDSCATVPEAVIAAAESFGTPPILLTGGTDKGLSADNLISFLTSDSKEQKTVSKEELPIREGKSGASPFSDIYFLAGTFTDKIIPSMKNAGIQFNGPYNSLDAMLGELKKSLDECVDYANCTKKLTIEERLPTIKSVPIVFSPGATSFGMFQNEFDRGNQFMEKVKSVFNT